MKQFAEAEVGASISLQFAIAEGNIAAEIVSKAVARHAPGPVLTFRTG